TPTATGDTTLTHKNTPQTVIYRYRRKNAGDVIVHHYEQGTNTPLVTDIPLNGTNKLGLPYNTNSLSIPNYTLVAMPSNQNGTFAVGTQHVYYYYKRNNAGNIVVNHYEVGGSTQLYKPTGSATVAAENYDGTAKLGLTENITNKAADIDNYEYVSVDVTGANGATSPSTTGATTVTYQTGTQTITYRYRRKNAGNITVNHYEVGTTTQLYKPTGSTTPAAENFDGTGKLGLTESLTNKAADIDNY
ncbi:MucBP domain protein, partial [Lachnospiraceae bacterium oral taxon 082 str. F0431]